MDARYSSAIILYKTRKGVSNSRHPFWLLGESETHAPAELFGDSTEREVSFEGVSLSDFRNREVTLEFEMKDAKIYSFEFV